MDIAIFNLLVCLSYVYTENIYYRTTTLLHQKLKINILLLKIVILLIVVLFRTATWG